MSKQWWERAAALDDPGAMYGLGALAAEDGDADGAQRWFDKAESTGDHLVSYGLARKLQDESPEHSQRLLEKAANGGCTDAAAQLGHIARGEAVPDGLVTAEVLAVRAENDKRLSELFSRVDVLVLPTTKGAPHPAEGVWVPELNPELTWSFNIAGVPAASVPAGFTQGGLPVGLQVVAAAGHELECILLASHVEELLGPPPLAPVPGQV